MGVVNYLKNLFLYKKSKVTNKDTYVEDNARADIYSKIVYCNNYKKYYYEHMSKISNIVIRFGFLKENANDDTYNDLSDFINMINKFNLNMVTDNSTEEFIILTGGCIDDYMNILLYMNNNKSFNIFVSEISNLFHTLTEDGFEKYMNENLFFGNDYFSEMDNYSFNNNAKDYSTTKKRIGIDNVSILEMDHIFIDEEQFLDPRKIIDLSYLYILMIDNEPALRYLSECSDNNLHYIQDEDGFYLIKIKCSELIKVVCNNLYNDSNMNHQCIIDLCDIIKSASNPMLDILSKYHIFYDRREIFGDMYYYNINDYYDDIDEVIE